MCHKSQVSEYFSILALKVTLGLREVRGSLEDSYINMTSQTVSSDRPHLNLNTAITPKMMVCTGLHYCDKNETS